MENMQKKYGFAAIIAVVIGIILFVSVAIPVSTAAIGQLASPGVNATTGLTQNALTVIQLIPLLLGVAALVFVVYSAMQ